MKPSDDKQCAEIKAILQKECDRDWKDDTLYQTAVIAANALYWRTIQIAELKEVIAAHERLSSVATNTEVPGTQAGSAGAEPAPSATRSATAESWVPVDERLPADETPVLILRNGERRIAELRWERPTFEETFKAFRYWDDPNDDGQCWEWPEITHWRPLPELPGEYVSPRPAFYCQAGGCASQCENCSQEAPGDIDCEGKT